MKENTLGQLIDQYYEQRQKRIEAARKVDKMKTEEGLMKARIMEQMDEWGLGKASGANATCGITTSIKPEIVDWDEVYKYIREEDRFDLLQKRMSVTAWRDMVLDGGELVPGTMVNEIRDLSLTRAHRS